MRLISSLFLLFCLVVTGHTQSGFIPLSLDHAFFRGAENQIYLEIYLSFNENYLTYKQQNNRLVAEYLTSAEIIHADSIIFQKMDRRISQLDSLGTLVTSRKFLNIFGFYLKPEKYSARVLVQDIHSPKLGEYIFDFTAVDYPADSLALSDIQLCSKITADTLKSDFQKNSYLVIPNPENTYGISLPIIYYYTELYNLNFNRELPGSYRVKCHISDLDGNLIKEYPEKVIKKPGKSAVLVGGHNIITLSNATYLLNLSVVDEQTGQEVHRSKRFTFSKPISRKETQTDSVTIAKLENQDLSYYLNFSEEDLNREFQKAGYLSSGEEKKIFKQLDLQGKRVFLARFWRKLDSNPQTEINEFKTRYMELVNFANNNFNTMKREGWQTDRGRVLLVYGTPNEIERNYMMMDMKPHEIWHYHELEGGVIFVFADLSGFGDFDLLHSTYSRELYQPEWQRLVRKTQEQNPFDVRN